MLTLHRASAGSGKTYALARRFIRLMISATNSYGIPILASKDRIDENLKHIIAITFTNKATNEMKARIVEKLADLAFYNDRTDKSGTLPDYMAEFAKEFNATYQEISHVSYQALSALLNNYTDFRVSTIDSFFQEILRTFSYESNLNESYQVEIDSKFLSAAAVDTLLENLDRKKDPLLEGSVYWLREMMDDKSQTSHKWNVFSKSGGNQSLYKSILNSLEYLDKEEFKKIKDELDNYFSEENSELKFITSFKEFGESARKEREERLESIKKGATELREFLETPEIANAALSTFINQMEKIATLSTEDEVKIKYDSIINKGTVFKAKTNPPHKEEIDQKALGLYEELTSYKEGLSTPLWKYYSIYSPLAPYLGLMQGIKKIMSSILNSQNLIKLSDTVGILKKIIGNDDTPFIYERLGSVLDHFLIDEFQDTSKMQWEVLSPLIHESEGRGKDNLIIGDAKQSIYRFRNAEPALITTDVPDEFPRHRLRGMSEEENINWRSTKNIVEFNNDFFTRLSEMLTVESETSGGKTDFSKLYENVRQETKHTKDEGYVEIRFSPTKPDNEDEDATEAPEDVTKLIRELLDRGYKQGEIAVLTDTNEQGKQVIESLVKFNAATEEEKKISFISEESLSLTSSDAVSIIINVLEKVSGQKPKHILPWEIKEPELNELMKTLSASVLPSFVETVVGRFLPESLKEREAAYISAFQDIVLDYCERFAFDPASFLEWWYEKGNKSSIQSPENSDAVNVMTIHKSKGLEFRCVIVPFAIKSMVPTSLKKEWKWVPVVEEAKKFSLPPYMPVNTTKELIGTAHEEIYTKYYDEFVMDRLNSTYVAFTRAIDELYIFTKTPENQGKTISHYLWDICGMEEGTDIFIFGHKNEKAKEKKKKNERTMKYLDRYYSHGEKIRLKFECEGLDLENSLQ